MKVECSISEETKEAVQSLIARRGEEGKVTIAEMCSDLIGTGAFRRLAANKWADEHKKPAKPRKARKPAPKAKAAPRKAAVKKVPKAKAPTVRKAKPAPAPAPEVAPAAAAASPLD